MHQRSTNHRAATTRAVLAATAAASISVVLAACSSRDGHPDSASHADKRAPLEHVHRLPQETPMYRTELQTVPAPPLAGQPTTLRFTVRDDASRTVPELALSHEKPMHLMIASTDLQLFAHVHPVADGGSFSLEHTFEAGGDYFLIADYQQPGRGQVVDRHRVRVEGAVRPAQPLAESARVQRADRLQLTMRSDSELRAGEPVLLHFDAVDTVTGEPVTDLEPYLGARAHFMVLSGDGEDFVHAHAMDESTAPSTVSAHAVYPRPGLYKLWAQMQRRGEVITVPFVLRVDEQQPKAAGSTTAAESGGHAHHMH
jgi:hypothetical protein